MAGLQKFIKTRKVSKFIVNIFPTMDKTMEKKEGSLSLPYYLFTHMVTVYAEEILEHKHSFSPHGETFQQDKSQN